MFKTCSTCGVEQPVNNYSSNGLSKKGTPVRRASCKSCESARLATVRNKDPQYNSKQAVARKERTSKRKKYEAYVKTLTFPVRCASCNTIFMVTTLPERPAKVSLTCNPCSEGKSKEKEKDASN